MGHTFAALWVALASLAACSSSPAADGVGGVDGGGDDPVESVVSEATTSTIDAPALSPAVEDQGAGRFALTYVDVAGASRTVLVEMRRPARVTGPAPVVIWSHGGATGKSSTARVGEGWGRAFNRAGFVFVAIAHPGRDAASRDELCAELVVDDCGSFMHLDWDRPADVRIVLDWLPGPFAGGLDLDRLVYGGHSAGGRSVLRIAGADIPFPGDRRPEPDRRFAAFLIASPPGAVHLGAASLDGVHAPLLILSGAGDSTPGTPADDRRATMSMLPDGDHVGIWVDDTHVRHTTLDLDTQACERSGATLARCRELVRGLGQAGTQFVQFALDDRSLDDFRALAAGRLPAAFEVR